MDCEQLRTSIKAQLERKLSWSERRRFRDHLKTCEACALAYEQAKQAWTIAREEDYSVSFDIGDKEHPVTPIVRMSHAILEMALKEDASELHLELTGQTARVSFDTEEGTVPQRPLPGYVSLPLAARFKTMAGLDVTRGDVEQQGTIQLQYLGKEFNASLKTEPLTKGERLIIQLH